MSFDAFLTHKGKDVKQATREEARYYMFRHGTTYSLKDYLWHSPDREAFWKAIKWSEQSEDERHELNYRCLAVRKAREEWNRFIFHVEPIEPLVPPLPE